MAVKNKKKDLHREITHQNYKYKNKLGDKGPQSWLPKEIIPLDEYFYKSKMGYSYVNDKYIHDTEGQYVASFIGG